MAPHECSAGSSVMGSAISVANNSGNCSVTLVPLPGVLSIRRLPPWDLAVE